MRPTLNPLLSRPATDPQTALSKPKSHLLTESAHCVRNTKTTQSGLVAISTYQTLIVMSTNSILTHRNSIEVNQLFLDTVEGRNLIPVVNFTTRANSLLDLVQTNQPGLLISCEGTAGFGDHETAVITKCHPLQHKNSLAKYIVGIKPTYKCCIMM